MALIFMILIIVASVVLGLIVLIQNPKGGGLSGSFGGFSNQIMGVKQTTDVLEKGTWIFAGIIAFLCIISPIFIPKNATAPSEFDKDMKNISVPAQNNSGATAPYPGTQQQAK